MLLRIKTLNGIRDGAVSLAFRRWKRPTVKAGGTLLTTFGQLEITSVRVVCTDEITDQDARQAGFAELKTLLLELNRRSVGDVFRIEFGALRPDPRIALRSREASSPQELLELETRLRRLDDRAHTPWTAVYLNLLQAHPGVRAGDLCVSLGLDKDVFKRNVRKLKNLGLTESLKVGYRLSPRGTALIEQRASARSD